MAPIQWSWGHGGAAFPWLPVTLLNAPDSRNACRILSQGDSSHPILCLANKPVSSLNINLGESHSKRTVCSVGSWSNKEKSFLILAQDGPGFTWTDRV